MKHGTKPALRLYLDNLQPQLHHRVVLYHQDGDNGDDDDDGNDGDGDGVHLGLRLLLMMSLLNSPLVRGTV